MFLEALLALSLATPTAPPEAAVAPATTLVVAETKPIVLAQTTPAPKASAPAQPRAAAPAPAQSEPKTAAPAPAPPASKAPPAVEAPAEVPNQVPFAMTAEVKSLVDRMQAFYEKTTDFQADFKQSYRYARMKRVQESSGKVTYLKPGMMRWDYAVPAPKTFVLAGDKIFAYDPAALQLTRAQIDTSQLSASVTFLFGQGNLAEEFKITKAACKECAGPLLELNPRKQDPRFKRIFLEVDPKSSQVVRSTVVDPDGSENTIRFLALKTNTGVTQDAFKIDRAPGTEMIDMTKLGAPKQP